MLPTVLKGIRDTGWASGEGELMEGTSTIATAFDTVLRPLAVSIPVPTARFSPTRSLFRDCLLQCRDKILSDIGLQALQQR
ncbi:hypothetical protein LMG3441_00746 [Achromobacter kerstersii]|uniref:IclR-ED domain-containing protein n=2 Tax=Achromobacter kerstersii TaxID=1353890 RepID=A0A6S6Z7N7_9BURK|nr:hypothetical protein LMG3441_00746 [Achromobacter kerstersii]